MNTNALRAIKQVFKPAQALPLYDNTRLMLAPLHWDDDGRPSLTDGWELFAPSYIRNYRKDAIVLSPRIHRWHCILRNTTFWARPTQLELLHALAYPSAEEQVRGLRALVLSKCNTAQVAGFEAFMRTCPQPTEPVYKHAVTYERQLTYDEYQTLIAALNQRLSEPDD
jgi:hypothetical protein